MKSEQSTTSSGGGSATSSSSTFAVRRRHGHVQYQQEIPNKLLPQSASQKDLDLLFTTKYIDTLNDLHRIQEENKRLMLRVRNLEAQIVPAGKSSQHTYIKMIAPSCLEYHQEERKINRALQDENEVLRRQFQNSVNAAAEANEKLSDALNRIKMMELEIVGKVDEVKQNTQTQHTQEIKKMQENLVDLERRWGAEKKQITMDRDSYALQCESLKVDAAAARAQLAEMMKQGVGKEELADLRMRLEIAEREKTDFQQKLSQCKLEIGRLTEKLDEFAELTETLQLVNQDQLGSDFTLHLPTRLKGLERSPSRTALSPTDIGGGALSRSRSSEKIAVPRSRSIERLAMLAKSVDKNSDRNLLKGNQSTNAPPKGAGGAGDALEARNREVQQVTTKLNEAQIQITKLESDIATLTAKNKELIKVAEQSRIMAEGMEAQNETLTTEVRRLSDKLRLLTIPDGRTAVRPPTPPANATTLSTAVSSAVFPSVRNNNSPNLNGSQNGKQKSKNGYGGNRSSRSKEEPAVDANTERSRPSSKSEPRYPSPPTSPWASTQPDNRQKFFSKKSF